METRKNLPLAVEIISSSQIVGNNNTNVQDVRQYAILKLSGMKSPPLLLREVLGFNQELEQRLPSRRDWTWTVSIIC